MSDYEDEMDVDAPSKDVQFSSENASGKKRAAADLPIQAQDNLPWYGVTFHGERNTCLQSLIGLKNTAQIRSMMSRVIKTF
jgi:hypothetical protein